VKVDGGLVQGVADGDLTVYKGIPFAAPPAGPLRWRAPQPVASWSGVRSADRFAPACMQAGTPPPGGVSEDCLHLNIWTPAKARGDRVPVLVWIYGGGFNGGATSHPVHDGAALARRGVVLVTVGYRVGVFGFFAHPELSAELPRQASGNYGLLDMIAGLQWIKRNISAFGGDPGRVTIFGESAGGTLDVWFTPPRAGTFIYHTHAHDPNQLSSGMYGALLVVPDRAKFNAEVEKVVLLGGSVVLHYYMNATLTRQLTTLVADASLMVRASV
jgi:carboxylesterase type B